MAAIMLKRAPSGLRHVVQLCLKIITSRVFIDREITRQNIFFHMSPRAGAATESHAAVMPMTAATAVTERSEPAQQRLADAVAGVVMAKYGELPKNGKPSPTEWTILAGLAASRPSVRGLAGAGAVAAGHDADKEVAVIALGTGSKCLSASKLRKDGRALNDSHAEVLARRSFIHFLQTQLLLLVSLGEVPKTDDNCILQWLDAPGFFSCPPLPLFVLVCCSIES